MPYVPTRPKPGQHRGQILAESGRNRDRIGARIGPEPDQNRGQNLAGIGARMGPKPGQKRIPKLAPNHVMNFNEEQGNEWNYKKIAYYQSGMIYMKLDQNDNAIEGFTQSLQISYPDEHENKWWNALFLRRLGLVHFFKGDYEKASKYYLDSYSLSDKIDDNEKYSIKSLCSYGFIEELLGNHDLAKERMIECSKWVLENRKQIQDNYDAYETIWPLYLYHKKLKQQEKSSSYLNIAYETIGKDHIERYHQHSEKGTHPEFFYSRDIIKAYEARLKY